LLQGPIRIVRHDLGKIMASMDHGKNLVMILNGSWGGLEQIVTGLHMILKDSRKVLEDSCEVLDVSCKICNVLYKCFMHGPDILTLTYCINVGLVKLDAYRDIPRR